MWSIVKQNSRASGQGVKAEIHNHSLPPFSPDSNKKGSYKRRKMIILDTFYATNPLFKKVEMLKIEAIQICFSIVILKDDKKSLVLTLSCYITTSSFIGLGHKH